MTINEENVLNISRSEVPHALGLEQRILAQTSEMAKTPQPLFWRRQFLPLMLAAGVAAFVVAAMIDVPIWNQTNNKDIQNQLTHQQASDGTELDEADLQEFLLLQDEYLFAQL